MIEQGTWPSQEWRLPPKQQVEGSNPSVPANSDAKVNIINPREKRTFS